MANDIKLSLPSGTNRSFTIQWVDKGGMHQETTVLATLDNDRRGLTLDIYAYKGIRHMDSRVLAIPGSTMSSYYGEEQRIEQSRKQCIEDALLQLNKGRVDLATEMLTRHLG